MNRKQIHLIIVIKYKWVKVILNPVTSREDFFLLFLPQNTPPAQISVFTIERGK